MPAKNILAFSSSRVSNSGYLEAAVPIIKKFLGNQPIKIAFVPFASLGNAIDYLSMVQEAFKSTQYSFKIVDKISGLETINSCDAIMIGGGNTFKLLHDLYDFDLFEIIKKKVESGLPYIGWSAGSNISGLSISTTNDMPIIQPPSFKAFGFLPFQINPHYLNEVVIGHNGETRDQRLMEFCMLHPKISVVGLPEGTFLQLQDSHLLFDGISNGILFQNINSEGIKKTTFEPLSNLSHLLHS